MLWECVCAYKRQERKVYKVIKICVRILWEVGVCSPCVTIPCLKTFKKKLQICQPILHMFNHDLHLLSKSTQGSGGQTMCQLKLSGSSLQCFISFIYQFITKKHTRAGYCLNIFETSADTCFKVLISKQYLSTIFSSQKKQISFVFVV